MVNSEPLVTVFALCYNHSRYLRDCLDSIKAQTYTNLQILIADDCSTDGSAEIIREWVAGNSALNIRFLAFDRNRGVCAVLNQLLSHAEGKYVSLVATDDVWLPGKTAHQVALMESLPDSVGVLYSDALLMDENGSRLPDRFIASHRALDVMPEGNIHQLLWTGNFIPAMSVLIRRSVFDAVGPYDDSLIYEDWDMWLRISEHFEFAFTPEVSAIYRVHRRSMSKTAVPQMTASNELIFIKHLRRRNVPPAVFSQAINFAVRRAFRLRETSVADGRVLLDDLFSIYHSPRIGLARILYTTGLNYTWYAQCVSMGRQLRSLGRARRSAS